MQRPHKHVHNDSGGTVVAYRETNLSENHLATRRGPRRDVLHALAVALPAAAAGLIVLRLLFASAPDPAGAMAPLDAAALLLACAGAGIAWRKAAARDQATPMPGPSGRDPLTGLMDRAAFDQALWDAADRDGADWNAAEPRGRAADGSVLGLLLVDVDGFRAVRATHGLTAADALLREIACHIMGLLPPGAVLARTHDDEFGILVARAAAGDTQAVAARIHQSLARPLTIGGGAMDVSVSVGAALLPDHAGTGTDLLRAAHVALLDAKSQGGNAWRLFDPGLGLVAQTRSLLAAELRGAIGSGELVPYYQPVIDLRSGAVAGWEVLARWRHGTRGMLLPDSFIRIAEEQKLCAALSEALLRQVTADCAIWPAHWTFAFNASPGQLRQLIDFVRDPAARPADMLDPRRIELEVTESALIDDMDLARRVVRAMHRGGTKVVLDDFGTGYANFVHLREIPFDRIKIDRSFVAAMLHDARTEACVRAMLALARSLGASVIAEGVETDAMAAHLQALGCEYAQGYYYAAPVPAAEVLRVAAQCQAMRRPG